MSRLVVNPRSEQAWHVSLRPGQLFLGRGPANDIQLDDPSVSERHCRIMVSDGWLQVEDLGSTNGTFVKGAAIRSATLSAGQTLTDR